ncbi:hypothetical protein NDK43_19655 [Neobacillus pocheonensis]|uniref:Plasmid segregation centromere-binding protein ParR n=1 Tax=Neobacillus pocheonensis TaxID=363869 RepID=A0ABT0WDP2_9BACI|nr:hypothetical protein [Neobacillus pocheonensis]
MKRGQVITFRLPSDTPEHILKYLQKLKESDKRDFSRKVAELVILGISNKKEQETISIPMIQKLTKEQRDWLKHEQTEALLGNMIYQLFSEPARLTSIEVTEPKMEVQIPLQDKEEMDDDLNDFEWDFSKENQSAEKEEEADKEDLLGGFLSSMNK